MTSTYYLLIKKRERQTGKNYLFEQVTLDKRKQLYSTTHVPSGRDELGGPAQKYSQSETRTKFDIKAEPLLGNKFSPAVTHGKFGQTVKAQSVPRQSDDALAQFSYLAAHKDSVKSDEHPAAFGSRHAGKQRTSPLPHHALYPFSDHATIKQTPPGGAKPETASDFAVPDIKLRGGQQSQPVKNHGILGANLTMRAGQASPQTSLPVPVFSNLQQLKQQIAANQQRGR